MVELGRWVCYGDIGSAAVNCKKHIRVCMDKELCCIFLTIAIHSMYIYLWCMMSCMRLKGRWNMHKSLFRQPLTPTTSPQTPKIATNMGGSNLEVFKVFCDYILIRVADKGGIG